jgi:cytochrome P450
MGCHKPQQVPDVRVLFRDKVCEELDSAFLGSDRPSTVRDLNEMKYLERVIKEMTRSHPSVATIGRKFSTDTDIGTGLNEHAQAVTVTAT